MSILEEQLRLYRIDLQSVQKDYAIAKVAYDLARKRKEEIEAAIQQVRKLLAATNKHEQGNTFIVRDHAIVRYLERKHEIDIAKLSEIILTPGVKDAIEKGLKEFRHDGLLYVLSGSTVVTVLKEEWRPEHTDL